MTTPQTNPFPSKGRVHRQSLSISAEEAMAAAAAAGFVATGQGKGHRVHIQRDWMTAAEIVPVPGGVVVRPAWTTAQVIAVGVFLALVVLAVCSGQVGPPAGP